MTEEEKSRFYYANIKDSFEKFNSFATAYSSQNAAVLADMYNYHINTKGATGVRKIESESRLF